MDYTNKLLQIIYGDATLGIIGDKFQYIFSYERGGLESLLVEGKEWLYRVPTPTFWRATTDNDHGNNFSVKSAQWFAADQFSIGHPIKLEIDHQEINPLPIAPNNNCYSNQETAKVVSITYQFQTPTVPQTFVDITYNVAVDRTIRIKTHYHGKKDLPELPAFGLRFIMPTTVASFDYEGLSGETYPDRMAGAIPGNFHVDGLPVTPYLVPQDCGVHMMTKRVTLNRTTTHNNVHVTSSPFSLIFSQAQNPFAFSCLPYTAIELESATHQEELPLPRRTVLSIYGATRGVGGIDSWGADVENNYHIPSDRDLEFDFEIHF